MKTCMIWGDLSSDRASEQYPTVAVCDDCVETDQAKGEDSQILSVADYDSDFGDTCAFCDTTIDEESESD